VSFDAVEDGSNDWGAFYRVEGELERPAADIEPLCANEVLSVRQLVKAA
jgi:hypothetical protein